MLEVIITYLNSVLDTTKFFDKSFGLSEQITKAETKSARFYCDGDWQSTTVFSENLGTSYWRKISETSSNIDNTIGCEKLLDVSYTLRLTAVVKNSHLEKNDAYSSDIAAQSIAKNIIKTNRTLKTTLKARRFSIDLSSIETDRENIIGSELSGIEKQDISYQYSVFTIDFDVNVWVTENCLLELCDETDFLCDLISTSNINKVSDCLQALPQDKKDIICIDLNCGGGGGGIIYQRPPITGQTASFATYDEGWQLAAGTYDYSPPVGGVLAQLDLNAVTPFETLIDNNFFGNKNRYTNDLGGAVTDGSDGSTALYRVDNLTGLGFMFNNNGLNENWATALSSANSFTVGIYSVFRVGTIFENTSIMDFGKSSLNVQIIAKWSVPISPITAWWSSTAQTVLLAWGFGGTMDIPRISTSLSGLHIPIRTHFT